MKLYLILSLFLFSCANEIKDVSLRSEEQITENNFEDSLELDPIIQFDRKRIRLKIDSIQANGGDLYVHCFVPLCDNDNQGIVPVSKSLGDGLNLRTNLYWATGHGMKGYFRKNSKWKTIKVYVPNHPDIMERCVFRTKVGNSFVYLITDAYRGDRMNECLNDYFNSLAGGLEDTIQVDSLIIKTNSLADMIVFNGHNGLMDNEIELVDAKNNKEKDAVAIGCISNAYFKPFFERARAYPLVMTTGLMYPGAFILDDIIKKWAINATELEIRYAAGDAYNRIMKCGQNGGRNLFSTGWDG